MRIPYSHTALGLVVIFVCSALSIEQSWSAASRFSATFSSPETEASRIVDGSKVLLAYHVTVLGEHEIDYEDVSEFVQGRHETLEIKKFAAAEHATSINLASSKPIFLSSSMAWRMPSSLLE
jgi:hypothetical protein